MQVSRSFSRWIALATRAKTNLGLKRTRERSTRSCLSTAHQRSLLFSVLQTLGWSFGTKTQVELERSSDRVTFSRATLILHLPSPTRVKRIWLSKQKAEKVSRAAFRRAKATYIIQRPMAHSKTGFGSVFFLFSIREHWMMEESEESLPRSLLCVRIKRVSRKREPRESPLTLEPFSSLPLPFSTHPLESAGSGVFATAPSIFCALRKTR